MEIQQTRQFLEQQLKRYQEQHRILEKIENKLHEMKAIAEYAAINNLNPIETEKSQDKMDQLQEEVTLLQTQLYSSEIIHLIN